MASAAQLLSTMPDAARHIDEVAIRFGNAATRIIVQHLSAEP